MYRMQYLLSEKMTTFKQNPNLKYVVVRNMICTHTYIYIYLYAHTHIDGWTDSTREM